MSRILLVLCLGVLATVTIAWSDPFRDAFPSVWGDRDSSQRWVTRTQNIASTRYFWRVVYFLSSPKPRLQGNAETVLADLKALPFDEVTPDCITPARDAEFAMWDAELRGFPCHCFWAWYAEGFANTPRISTVGYFELPKFFGSPHARIPTLPIWHGLLINTAFWAAVFELVLRITTRAWRWLARFSTRSRLSRGLCINCAYPRDGVVGVCPECGHASQ